MQNRKSIKRVVLPTPSKKILARGDAAAYLRIDPEQLDKLTEQKALQSIRIQGAPLFYRLENLREFLSCDLPNPSTNKS